MTATRRSFLKGAMPAGLALLATAGSAAPAPRRAPPPAPGSREPVIDLHSHWFSPKATALLSARRFGPQIFTDANGAPALRRSGAGEATAPFALGRQWFDIEARAHHLEEVGVAHQLLSWPTTLGIDPALPPADTRTLFKDYNDDLSGVVRAWPRQFSGVAALPTSDIAWSAEELARAHGDLGLIGAVLPVNGFASLEAARHFAPVFARAQREKSHIFLHTGFAHQSVPGQPPLYLHSDAIAVRNNLDTAWQFASAVITLAYTDFLDAYPDVTVQIAMLGGSGIAALVAEASALPGRADGAKPRFDRLWLDTGAAGQGPAAIAAAARVLGPTQIVFGSDFAPSPSVAPVIANVRAAGLPRADERRILFGNARALLARHGVALPAAADERDAA